MNQQELGQLVASYTSGNISADEHAELATELRQNADSRRLFRELVDLEFGLTCLANEIAETQMLTVSTGPPPSTNSRRRLTIGMLTFAASLIAVSAFVWIVYFASSANKIVINNGVSPSLRTDWNGLGSIRQTNCSWDKFASGPFEGQFSVGQYKLKTGVAELNFNSGTTITIEGPCELNVDSKFSAELTAGKVVMNVSDISDGFLLKTPMAHVVDDGTEYAVSVDDVTEIHVFDGSVVWQPNGAEESDYQRIDAGEATQFSESNVAIGKRIPFGQRQFVRRLEAAKQSEAEGNLIAYDGFENLAGRIRSGRSGFGWDGGWHPPGRRRANAMILDSPPGIAFGHDRTGLRMIQVGNGITIQRTLKEPLLKNHQSVYISFVLYRESSFGERSSFQLSIGDSSVGRPARRKVNGIGLGITSEGFPFLKHGGVIHEVANRVSHKLMLCVARIVAIDDSIYLVQFRVFADGDSISAEPTSWTVSSSPNPIDFELNRIQLSSGDKGLWRVDELRIGKTWDSILND
ncbi:MAG: FecR domain-containing protein [Planctomycetota bacterium]